MYPIHGGSLYLGHHPEYVQSLWNEISAKTGILSNQANDNYGTMSIGNIYHL
jgi:endoglucanase Acf2